MALLVRALPLCPCLDKNLTNPLGPDSASCRSHILSGEQSQTGSLNRKEPSQQALDVYMIRVDRIKEMKACTFSVVFVAFNASLLVKRPRTSINSEFCGLSGSIRNMGLKNQENI